METVDATEKIEIPDPLGRALKEFFGMSYLFPYQRLVIANILEAAASRGIGIKWPGGFGEAPEEDTGSPLDESDAESLGRQIVILPTGAGKSLCFQLPAMLLDGPTLVIYPILSLMADQERRLKEMPQGFAPVTLRGGQSREERAEIWAKIRSRESRFIIANPEVLLTPQVMEELGKAGLIHLVIDEAHTVSEWGESFRPSYLRIGEIIEAAGRPLVTAFTATASAPVLEKIEKYIFGVKEGETGTRRIIGNPDRSNISYSARGAILKDLAVRDLLAKYERPAIVFCSSRKGTENLARYLRNGLSEREIKFYHAGLSRPEKTAVEKWFFGSPGGVLIATCAYGMGVDKADIRTVIHRDCPPSVEAYLQESGRAGRDGKQSHAFLLWGPEDEGQLRRAKTEADRSRIRALLAYAHCTDSCRRENLLKLLNYDSNGTAPESDCCDVCESNASDELREVRSVWDFIRRNQRRYTMGEAASLIASNPAVNCSDSEAMELLRNLKKQKKIVISRNFLWKNKLRVLR
ncbi:RecQ family ATP-dependent DNA helicase [Leadbettera azotonutricia]|nr:RecQ family ATP-dependent DNA helicase [Leadbettera azotonutricia]